MHALVLALALIAQQPEYRLHKIVTADGLHLTVKGYIKPGDRLITWSPDDPYNVQAVAEARREAAKNAYAVNGVQWHGKKRDVYTLPSDEAKKYVADARYGDEPAKVHVTVIGNDTEVKAVMDDIQAHPAFSGLHDALMVQGYKPGDWAVDSKLGFQAGSPAIIVQLGKCPSDPTGGKVIYRVSNYAAGPEPIAEAIRKANPSYNPAVDPGPTSSVDLLPLGLTSKDLWAVLGGILVVLLVPSSKKRESS